ncbi:MAG TPA: alpha/beta fold hydrolase [Flavipsychrobacter sp.]|nr:alpha/beta fold hydrolase [Flavipsychrobacter sp.]
MERKIGCLVIHGFGGSVKEVAPLVEALERKGFLTQCPSLSGHTGKKKDLKTVTYNDWIASAEKSLKLLKMECDEVFIAGFSMGGLIGIQLAQHYDICGLIIINTPIYYCDFRKIFSNVIHDVFHRDYQNIRRYLRPSNRLPLKALWNFKQLLRRTKKLVYYLKTPVLIAQAIDDDMVQHRSAGFIYTKAISPVKKLATYVRGGHVLLLSETCHALIKDTLDFLDDRINTRKSLTQTLAV